MKYEDLLFFFLNFTLQQNNCNIFTNLLSFFSNFPKFVTNLLKMTIYPHKISLNLWHHFLKFITKLSIIFYSIFTNFYIFYYISSNFYRISRKYFQNWNFWISLLKYPKFKKINLLKFLRYFLKFFISSPKIFYKIS